ncbi:MAG: hypothetical protein ACFHWX_14100 [Bacteroidota bacterium]
MARRGNFEDDGFEKAWSEAFEDASTQPNPRVWNNIERDLAYQQMATLKKKAKFYQWTAAAAIFIAAFLGINYLISDEVVNNQVLVDSNQATVNGEQNSVKTSNQAINEDQVSQASIMSNQNHSLAGSLIANSASKGDTEKIQSGNHRGGLFVSNDNESGNSNTLREPIYLAFATEGKRIEAVDVDYSINENLERKMYNRAISARFIKKKTKKEDNQERFWAGIGYGSGSFDPNYQSGASNLLASSLDLGTTENFAASNTFRIESQSPSVREGMKSGITMDLGLNFGMRVSDNWIFESGLIYSQANAVTQTNLVVESPNVVEPIAASSETRGVTELSSLVANEKVIQYNYQDVSLDNQFYFASLPLKAGFVLIDSKLNVIINAGVSTNLYLGNKLVDPTSEVANVAIGPGTSSPYREISFSGLGGLQIGYSLFDQFELTVEPYMRQPITALTKENTSFIASPSGMGINTGIRYRFN